MRLLFIYICERYPFTKGWPSMKERDLFNEVADLAWSALQTLNYIFIFNIYESTHLKV